MLTSILEKTRLNSLYVDQKKSAHDIARELGCSENKVNYWLAKHGIEKRSISDAIYLKHNPTGDPFLIKSVHSHEDAFISGLGLGLYWGEGTKRNKTSVRLGNTDPYLIKAFLLFLRRRYQIDESRLRFSLQIFTDMNQKTEERFWSNFLGIPSRQFYKTINTRSGSIGTYREKSKHGVLTIYFGNRKLRDMLISEIERIKEIR